MLEILYAGTRNTLFELDFDFTGDYIKDVTALTLLNIKGGMLMAQSNSDPLKLYKCDADVDLNVLGPLVNDADGYLYENLPTVASKKAVIMTGMGTYKVDAEALWTGAGDYSEWTAADIGKAVYCAGSQTHNEHLTNTVYAGTPFEANVGRFVPFSAGTGSSVTDVVGICVKLPTVDDPTMIYLQRI